MKAEHNPKHRSNSEIGELPARRCTANRRLPSVLVLLAALAIIHLRAGSGFAQDAKEEVVANLAAGRVTVLVAKGGILVATQGKTVEPGSRMPVVLELSRRRVVILMGAVEWAFPSLNRPTIRLSREVPALLGQIAGPKRMEAEQSSDIEQLGMALLEPLRPAAAALRSKIEFSEDEPVVEMLIIGYAEDYGAEVWQLKYRLRQDLVRGDYWRTRILNPSYEQLYPPEKGQPRTIVESRYPADDEEPGLPQVFHSNDPRLDRARQSSTQSAKAAQFIARGESHKADLDGATEFFRAALNAVVPESVPLGLLIIREQRGVDWVIAPPERPEVVAEAPAKPREPGAPTLRKP